MTDRANRQHLLVCEARYWLRRGVTTPEKVAELRETLKRRGESAVEQLIAEMRRQWQARTEWIGGEDGRTGQIHAGSRGAGSHQPGALDTLAGGEGQALPQSGTDHAWASRLETIRYQPLAGKPDGMDANKGRVSGPTSWCR